MIISQTPLRISFVGGGTDLPDFYHENKGSVISATIDKYIYILLNPRLDDKLCINYGKQEFTDNLEGIEHKIIRECLRKAGIKNGINLLISSDITSEGSGLGSSSALTVGLLNAMYSFLGVEISAAKLAKDACEIEIEVLHNPIGRQDQYSCAYGGINQIEFFGEDQTVVTPVNISSTDKEKLNNSLMLFFTGITRKASVILSRQKENIPQHKQILIQMRDQSYELRKLFEGGKIDRLGDFLDSGWRLKKELAVGISNAEIDQMYNNAKKAGALGGKITGAGGGGFLLIYAPENKQNEVCKMLGIYNKLDVNITNFGSRIVFSSSN